MARSHPLKDAVVAKRVAEDDMYLKRMATDQLGHARVVAILDDAAVCAATDHQHGAQVAAAVALGKIARLPGLSDAPQVALQLNTTLQVLQGMAPERLEGILAIADARIRELKALATDAKAPVDTAPVAAIPPTP